MVHVDAQTGTVFLNAATVPRVRHDAGGNGGGGSGARAGEPRARQDSSGEGAGASGGGGGGGAARPGATLRHFLVFELTAGAVESAADVWVRTWPAGGIAAGGGGGGGAAGAGLQAHGAEVASEAPVLKTVAGEQGVVKAAWNAAAGEWEHFVLAPGAAGAPSAAQAAAAAAAGADH